MRLVLVSHGSTAAVRSGAFPDDEPLDRLGREQVRTVRAALPRADEVRCAPNRRCAQTAEALGLAPVVDPALAGPDYGDWAGRSIDDVAATDPTGLRDWTSDPAFRGHGGESLAGLVGRTGRWLDDRTAPPHSTLAVCDPAVLRAALVHALGAPPEAIHRVEAGPLSLAVLVGEPGRWGLRSVQALAGRRGAAPRDETGTGTGAHHGAAG